MEESRFDRLSPRQRDCLRLTYAHRTTKEIARELGIGAGTVDGYLAEAIAIVGAANRRQAAIRFHAHESQGHGVAPGEIEGQSAGVGDPPAAPPASAPASPAASRGGPLAPRNRDADNDLGILGRLAWIILLAAALAVGYGALAGGTRTFNDLYVAFGQLRAW